MRLLTALHVAASLGGAKGTIHYPFRRAPRLPESTDRQAFAKVKRILECDIDVNARTDEGVTPILCAALTKNRPVIELLLANGAQVDLHTACCLGMRKEARTLLSANPALAMSKDNNPLDRSPVHWAVFGGDAALAGILLKLGADPNALARQIYYGDTVGFTIRTSRFSTSKVKETETPLQLATTLGHKEIADLLIRAGATEKPTTP